MRFTRSAIRHAVQALPAETLVSLLGSRYCETDRLSEIAWNPVLLKVLLGGDVSRRSATAARLHCLVVWQSFERFLAVLMRVTSLRLNEYACHFRMRCFDPALDARHGFLHFCCCVGVDKVQA